MRIGMLGGTFDPIHEGHLALARAALKELRLDRLIFIPAFRHPLEQKDRKTVASPEARLEMVRLAVRGESQFELSDCEIKRKGISYTVDTLREFRSLYPKPHELYFLTGGDWGKNLSRWKDIRTIFSLARFVVARRPGFDISPLPKEVEFLDFIPLDISSTAIREKLKKGASVSSLVPKQVLEYMIQHKLYQN
ncbi:MAG: nicotinate-nucleotide adenylyltransferase [Candidatus Omnitrophica bacterium]|nr:nicotinate-nucleotide adenylyltransferase [Candidatus Omnitrophota bacterium]